MSLETERVRLRKLTLRGEDRLKETLQDEKLMYACEHAFSDEEIKEWSLRQRKRYETVSVRGRWNLNRRAFFWGSAA